MTTVACDRATMACDSQITSGGVKSRGRKIYTAKGALIGFAGNVEMGALFVQWYRGNRSEPPPMWDSMWDSEHDDFSAIVLLPSGKILEYGTKLVAMQVEEKFHAIGGGADMAIGAMEAGVSPIKAVQICCRRSDGTSGRVRYKTL